MIVNAEFWPLDTVAGVRKRILCTTHNTPDATGLNGETWHPAILEAPTIGIRLFKGDFDGTATASGGLMKISLSKLEKDEPNIRRYVWAGAPHKFWAGVPGQAWPWMQAFEGKVDSFSAEASLLEVRTKVNDEPFQADVLVSKYAGTGGVEGSSDLKERPKPLLVGRCFNAQPIQINAVDHVYQFHGYGPIQAVPKLYERGSDFGASVGDFANYAALVAATIPEGAWGTCLAQGLIRLGAPAYGLITGDVDGDKDGGTWRRKPGEVILRLCSLAGVSGGLIESASFTAVDTALAGLPNLGRIGHYQTEQISVLSLSAALANDANHALGVSLLGKLFAMPLTPATPSVRLDAQGREPPKVFSSVEAPVSPPYSLLEMGYARSWRVHTEDEISEAEYQPSYTDPNPPPNHAPIGTLWFNVDRMSFRLGSRELTIGGVPVTFGGQPITTSGWKKVRDRGIDFAIEEAFEANALGQAAITALRQIDDDGILDVSEKQTLISKKLGFDAMWNAVSASAAVAGVATDVAAGKRAAFMAFLASISPEWNDTSRNSPIARSSLDKVTDEFVQALEDLQSAVIEAMGLATAPRVDAPAGYTFTANYLGALDGGQLPKTFPFRRFRGATDVSAASTWTVVDQAGIAGGTVTIVDGNAVIPTGCTVETNAKIQVRSVHDGIPILAAVALTRVDAAPPNTGGGGGGTTVSDNTLLPMSGVTKIEVSDIMRVKTGPAGTVTFAGYLGIYAEEDFPTGLFGAAARWAIRPISGAWSMVGSQDIFETIPAVVRPRPDRIQEKFEPDGTLEVESGLIDVASVRTGLTPNTDYEVVLNAARDRNDPVKTIYLSGTIYAQGS